jgi:probable HAF family extracellular repeat protein
MRTPCRTLLRALSAVVGPAALMAVGLGAAPAAAAIQYTITDLGTLGGSSSYASAINDLGQVAGAADTADGDEHAFRYRGDEMKDLDGAAGSQSFASGINKYAQVVGLVGEHAFLCSGSRMVDLGTLGGTSAEATDINDLSQIVGFAATTNDMAQHAFLYVGGRMRTSARSAAGTAMPSASTPSATSWGAPTSAGTRPSTPSSGRRES